MYLFIADGHFVGAPDEAQRFLALLAAAETAAQRGGGLTEVAILGDLFELWLGLDGLEAGFQTVIFAPLFALKARGVKLHYVVGNKDFFVREWNLKRRLFDSVIEKEVLLSTPFGQVRLAHGDLVNRADRQYRLWRAFSRSWPMQMLMRLLPRRRLAQWALVVAERMKTTNQYHKSYYPEAHLIADAQASPRVAMHLYGHFHVHRELESENGRVVTLPFLGGEMAGLLLGPQGLVRVSAS